MTADAPRLVRGLDAGRRAVCAAGDRIVREMPLTGRRSALALRLAPPARGRDRPVDLAGLRVVVGDGTAEERMLQHWPGSLRRHYERSPLGRALARGAGGLFVDVGANLGMYSVVALRHGWSTVRVEPDERLRPHHERNAALGPFHPVALAATPGRRRFFEGADRGAASLVPGREAGAAVRGAATVVVDTADELLLPLVETAEEPTLVKVDVEGAEAELVRGAARLIGGPRPVLWCEVRGRASTRAPSTDVAVHAALEGTHRVYTCTGDAVVAWAGPSDGGVYDLLAVPGEGRSAALGAAVLDTLAAS